MPLDPCGGGRLFCRLARRHRRHRRGGFHRRPSRPHRLWLAWRISTHAISLAFILLGVAGFALLYDRWRSPYLAVALAALCGATFNFLDILVNPPMMPMLLAFVVLAAQERPPGSHAPQPLGAGWLPLWWR